MEEEELIEDKYWNELLQTLTGDDNFKIRKTEIDSLNKTETIEFFQHLNYFQSSVTTKLKKMIAKNG